MAEHGWLPVPGSALGSGHASDMVGHILFLSVSSRAPLFVSITGCEVTPGGITGSASRNTIHWRTPPTPWGPRYQTGDTTTLQPETKVVCCVRDDKREPAQSVCGDRPPSGTPEGPSLVSASLQAAQSSFPRPRPPPGLWFRPLLPPQTPCTTK